METKTKTARQQRICTEVSVIGVRFSSIEQAAQALGLAAATVIKRCRSKNPRYAQWKVVRETAHKYSSTPQPVTIGGTHYPSITAAARALKLARTVVLYRCTNHLTVDGVTYDLHDTGE